MANEIITKDIAEASFTITMAPSGVGLANGSGRSSASVSNSNDYPAALVSINIMSGLVAPTAGYGYFIYLLRDTGTVADDGWGGSDASYTHVNAPLLGSIIVTANASTDFAKVFDTAPLGPLGPTWGIAIVNSSGQSIHSTEANHDTYYNYYVPEQSDP